MASLTIGASFEGRGVAIFRKLAGAHPRSVIPHLGFRDDVALPVRLDVVLAGGHCIRCRSPVAVLAGKLLFVLDQLVALRFGDSSLPWRGWLLSEALDKPGWLGILAGLTLPVPGSHN